VTPLPSIKLFYLTTTPEKVIHYHSFFVSHIWEWSVFLHPSGSDFLPRF
jgi:hypothetical protein